MTYEDRMKYKSWTGRLANKSFFRKFSIFSEYFEIIFRVLNFISEHLWMLKQSSSLIFQNVFYFEFSDFQFFTEILK